MLQLQMLLLEQVLQVLEMLQLQILQMLQLEANQV
ncbi:hypothetical protein MTR67_052665 [Solanum verrucosum]|uniref:Uncharacterized protein n=1 Tax=Solanum verrucosum TaxID=315347 RepID=A0AAF0V7B1_SOLVR|nr:hypothetical protein MTR67_052665 [Solanum verrucosum]